MTVKQRILDNQLHMIRWVWWKIQQPDLTEDEFTKIQSYINGIVEHSVWLKDQPRDSKEQINEKLTNLKITY